MGKEPTTKERLAAIEALMQERKEVRVVWQGKVDGKLDKIISNGRNLATVDVLKDTIVAHAESCPARSNPSSSDNPGNGKLDMLLKGYRGLGIFGCMLVINGLLIVAILKLVEVF